MKEQEGKEDKQKKSTMREGMGLNTLKFSDTLCQLRSSWFD